MRDIRSILTLHESSIPSASSICFSTPGWVRPSGTAMMRNAMVGKHIGYLYIAATVLFTVYGQLIIKWEVNRAGALPEAPSELPMFLFRLLTSPWVLSGFVAAFLASVAWMAALTKFQLSYAYPFVALTFVLVVLAGSFVFDEPISVPKLAGLALIVAGITLAGLG